MNTTNFVGSEIEGITVAPETYKKIPPTPHEPSYTTSETASEVHVGDTRQFVTCKYSEVPSGTKFFREYKKDHFMPFDKNGQTDSIFGADYIVWVFRKVTK